MGRYVSLPFCIEAWLISGNCRGWDSLLLYGRRFDYVATIKMANIKICFLRTPHKYIVSDSIFYLLLVHENFITYITIEDVHYVSNTLLKCIRNIFIWVIGQRTTYRLKSIIILAWQVWKNTIDSTARIIFKMVEKLSILFFLEEMVEGNYLQRITTSDKLLYFINHVFSLYNSHTKLLFLAVRFTFALVHFNVDV